MQDDDGDETDVQVHEFLAEEVLVYARRALLLGHAGSGKTTLLQWLCTKVVEKSLRDRLAHLNFYTPFFIRLRDFYQRELPIGNDPISCASRALTSHVPDGWIADILREGKAIFFIDGFDEISKSQRLAIDKWVNELIELSPESYFVITPRPAAVDISDFEENEFQEFYLRRMAPITAYASASGDAICCGGGGGRGVEQRTNIGRFG